MDANWLLESHLKTLRLASFRQQYRPVAEDAARTNLSYDRYLLALAEPEGYIRVFVNEGPPLAALLERIKVEDGRLKEYVLKLLSSFPEGIKAERPSQGKHLQNFILHPSSLSL